MRGNQLSQPVNSNKVKGTDLLPRKIRSVFTRTFYLLTL